MSSTAARLKSAPPSVRFVDPVHTRDLYHDMDLLRFSTAGSVDDGKSTLIGRLLYDTKSIFEDQLESLENASRRRGEDYVNLALLTDGLRAEREQNITIDVAYRYFATPRRKFIIADTPGHEQYTRNMVTGASTVELAVVLVDVRKGVVTQSRRHAFISSLLGIPHLVITVNKMDLVGYDESCFQQVVTEFSDYLSKLGVKDVTFIPISALQGDNVVERSPHMPWYQGTTLLHHLETVSVAGDRNLRDFRFPVQVVIRPHQDFRGLAGRVASGTIRSGEEVVVLPSGAMTRVKTVENASGPMEQAVAGDSVVLTITDELDVGRGDMIVRRHNLPSVGTHLDVMMCWMSQVPFDPNVQYVLMQTTRSARAYVSKIHYRIDVDTLGRHGDSDFALNDIGRAEIRTAQPMCFDPYSQNASTGSFILVDPFTNATVAAGTIRGEVREVDHVTALPSESLRAVSPGAIWQDWNIAREERERRYGHKAAILWFTGLSGSGKSTIARALERELFAQGCQTMLIDGDQVRHGLCGDLGFSAADRAENIRRAGEVAHLAFEHGNLVLCAFVSPFRGDRDRVRSLFPTDRFLEVFVDCDLAECRRRDPKGLYASSEQGKVSNLTGVGQPYEPPVQPDLRLDSRVEDPKTLVDTIIMELRRRAIVP